MSLKHNLTTWTKGTDFYSALLTWTVRSRVKISCSNVYTLLPHFDSVNINIAGHRCRNKVANSRKKEKFKIATMKVSMPVMP